MLTSFRRRSVECTAAGAARSFTHARVLALALVLVTPAAAAAQEIAQAADGTLSVRASGVPLGQLLEALGRIEPLGTLVLTNGVEERRVTIALTGLSPRRAVLAVLEAAGVDYVLGQRRLVAGDAAFRGTGGADRPPAVLHTSPVAEPPATPSDPIPDPPATPSADAAGFTDDRDAIATAVAEAEARTRAILLEQDLSAPMRVRPGGVVALPFPGPDGVTPVTVVKPLTPGLPAVPFPAGPAAGAAPDAPAPLPADPQLRQLIEALSPPPAPRR
jgi:hypothetical protein